MAAKVGGGDMLFQWLSRFVLVRGSKRTTSENGIGHTEWESTFIESHCKNVRIESVCVCVKSEKLS